MDVTSIIAGVVLFLYFVVAPFVGGWVFLLNGLNKWADYDPEYDEIKKKHAAWLDIFFGSVLLIFFNLQFWLVLWPVIVMQFKLNLPAFSL